MCFVICDLLHEGSLQSKFVQFSQICVNFTQNVSKNVHLCKCDLWFWVFGMLQYHTSYFLCPILFAPIHCGRRRFSTVLPIAPSMANLPSPLSIPRLPKQMIATISSQSLHCNDLFVKHVQLHALKKGTIWISIHALFIHMLTLLTISGRCAKYLLTILQTAKQWQR